MGEGLEYSDLHIAGSLRPLPEEPTVAVTLITASLEESGLETLRHYGEVRYQPMVETHSMLGGSRLVKALADVDIFITEADNLRQRELDALDHLQVICSCRGNPVNIDVAAATRKGIPVVHAPARNSEGVADLALLLMLMLSRRIPQVTGLMRDRTRGADMSAMAKVYFELRGQELWNKVVGVVGLGAIGRKVAERVRACGAKVISYDPYVAGGYGAARGGEGRS